MVDVRKLLVDEPDETESAAPHEAESERAEPMAAPDVAGVTSPAPAPADSPEGKETPAERGFPRIAFVERLDGSPGSHAELDLHWGSQRWILPSDGETILGRWLSRKSVSVGQRDDGPETVFDAVGAWALTDKRLIGLLAGGRVGDQTLRGDNAILVVMPLDEVDSVSLMRERTRRGLEDSGVGLYMTRAGVFLDLDQTFRDSRRAYKQPRIESMRLLIGAIAEAKRPTAGPELVALLDAAVAERWVTDEDDELVAVLSKTAWDDHASAAGAAQAGRGPDEPETSAPHAMDTTPATGWEPPGGSQTTPRTTPDLGTLPPPGAPPPNALPPPYVAPPRQIDLKLGRDVPVRDSLRTIAFAAAGACLLLLILLLLPWQRYVYSPSSGTFDPSRTGLHGLGVLVLLAALVLGLAALAVATRQHLPLSRLVLGWSLIGGGALVFLVTLAHVLSTDGDTAWPRVALLVALLAGPLLALAGAPFAFLEDDEEDLTVRDAVALVRSRGIGPAPRSAPTAPPAGWYDDPERPGGKRWWDGIAWQMTDLEYHERVKEES
jgi:hypothetical protein